MAGLVDYGSSEEEDNILEQPEESLNSADVSQRISWAQDFEYY